MFATTKDIRFRILKLVVTKNHELVLRFRRLAHLFIRYYGLESFRGIIIFKNPELVLGVQNLILSVILSKESLLIQEENGVLILEDLCVVSVFVLKELHDIDQVYGSFNGFF